MAEPIRRPSEQPPATLRRPALPLAPTVGGFAIQPRPDAVLRHLARTHDEREWRRMIDTDDAISSAIRQRVAGLLEDGWEIVPGGSSSSRAYELRDFVDAALCACEIEFSVVLAEMLDSVFYGWVPVETTWDVRRIEGRESWVPSGLVAHEPWRFRFTVDGDLVHTRGLEGQVFKLDDPIERLRWLLCRSGTVRTPYGQSWLSPMWLLWFVRQEFAKMSAQGVQRALGVFKAIRKGGAASSALPGGQASKGEITQELEGVMRMLDSQNLLVESMGWSFEHLASPGDAVKNIVDLQRMYDERIRIGIVGQNLTSSVGPAGSLAASRTHLEILSWYWMSDGRLLASWLNRLIRKVVDVNYGDQAPADYPTWTLRIFKRPDLEATRTYFDMGGKIDGRAFADRLNVPAILDEPDDDAVVLERGPRDAALGVGSSSDEGGDAGRDGSGRAALARAGGRGDVVADALRGFTGKRLAELYGETARAVLRDNPDPK